MWISCCKYSTLENTAQGHVGKGTRVTMLKFGIEVPMTYVIDCDVAGVMVTLVNGML